MYPRFFQHDLLKLDLYKSKQLLGKFHQDEVNNYKRINFKISDDLNKTFNANWNFPTSGLIIGAGLFSIAHIFNLSYGLRAGLVIFPVAVDFLTSLIDKKSYFRSLEFMDWLI